MSVTASSSSQQFAQKISMDEYNRQSSEYTKKALGELNTQLQSGAFTRRRRVPDSDETDEDDVLNDLGDSKIHIQIDAQPPVSRRNNGGQKQAPRRTNSTSDFEYFDKCVKDYNSRIQSLTRSLTSVKSELSMTEGKLYQCQLDLSSATVDKGTLKVENDYLTAQVSLLNDELKQLKTRYSVYKFYVICAELFFVLVYFMSVMYFL